MPNNPAITHSLIAISAFHQAASLSRAALPPATAEEFRGGGDTLRHSDLALARNSDALVHSALSVGSLREALGSSDCSDALVATIFLLVWADLVEDGRMDWKLHLDGLKVLLSLRRQSSSLKFNLPFQRWSEETFSV